MSDSIWLSSVAINCLNVDDLAGRPLCLSTLDDVQA